MKTRILVIGPSAHDSKGGMATVIEEIQEDRKLNKTFKLDVYPSYRDGNKILVLFYSFLHIAFFILQKEIMIFIIFIWPQEEVPFGRGIM